MAVRALRQAASLEHQPRVAVVHGPNLNTLGRREPQIYGTQTLEDINGRLLEIGADLGFELSFFQSNHEGALIDHLQSLTDRSDGVIINAGAYSHSPSRCATPSRPSSSPR
jgi:3-dehydroquinate dehydratase-2